jgi:DNA-binding NarL/FixJ family response regulator
VIRLAAVGTCPAGVAGALRALAVDLVEGATNGADLARLTGHRPPERVAYFPGGPPDTARRLARWLARRYPTVVVGPRDWPEVGSVIAAGACAYLVHEPGSDPAVTAAMLIAGARPPVTGGRASRARLSQRERETLAYLAAGYTHRQTALRMNVSKATVDTFVARIRTKLAVGNKADLTRAALTDYAGDEPR